MSSIQSSVRKVPFTLNICPTPNRRWGNHRGISTYPAAGRIEAEIPVPANRAMRLSELAFVLLGLSTEMGSAAEKEMDRQGHKISCRKGCGACCRQFVPVSPAEAWMIAELLQSM